MTTPWALDDEDELALLLAAAAQAASVDASMDELDAERSDLPGFGLPTEAPLPFVHPAHASPVMVIELPDCVVVPALADASANCATTAKATILTPAAIFFMFSSRLLAGGLSALRTEAFWPRGTGL